MSPGEYLSFLSIDKWTIIFNLVNTFILYKIIKRFLFKPVNKMLESRKLEVEESYNNAQTALAEAEQFKNVYESKLKEVNKEAEKIIDVAKTRAYQQSNEIIKVAKATADDLIKKADQEIKLESKKAINNIKNQVVDVIVLATSKVIKKEIPTDKHKEIIDEFFNEVKA